MKILKKVGGNIDSNTIKYSQYIDKNTLKYGYCSYFSLAILNEFPEHNAIKIVDFDSEIQVNYLVHIVLQNGQIFYDSLGQYQSISQSIRDISDIECMNLRTQKISQREIVRQIEDDLGHFDHELFHYIRTYVRKNYINRQ